MAKTVGFSCPLKLMWLNKAAELTTENLSVSEYKEALNDYLAFEIEKGTVRHRKTRDILMNIWYHDTNAAAQYRSEALTLLNKYPEHGAIIHLCLIYHAYPVVADICKYIGRILEQQECFTNAQLSKKLYDEWGERGTLQTTCRRVSLTLKEFGVLKNKTKLQYASERKSVVEYPVVRFILSTAMSLSKDEYHTMQELCSFDIMFPVEYGIDKCELVQDDKFSVNSFGGEVVVSLR